MLTMYEGPGKFEGELALAPLAYEASCNGFGEPYDFGNGDGYVDHYTVCDGPLEPTEAEIFKYGLSATDVEFARNLIGFIVHEGDAGFVSVSWYAKGEEVAMATAASKLDTEMGELEQEQEGEEAEYSY